MLNRFVLILLFTLPLLSLPSQQHASTNPWWKHAVFYEIYPRSFSDSNGDGIGDLNGITNHLDYLQGLGVDALWIAPMYPSPQVDFGYDISDYQAIDPMYGTLADFDHLQAEAKKRGLRVILDMVLNHTSDKSKWFLESASSRDNEKADWYVWSSGIQADGPGVSAYQRRFEHDGVVPPNNWTSAFGGSAWEWVSARKQYYYHFFYKQQPDLNWRNPAVEQAMFNAMKFWLDRGLSGFRLDAIPTLFEDQELRDQKEMGGVNAQGDPNLGIDRTYDLPEVHDVLRRLRKLVNSYPGQRVLIGETYTFNTADLDAWYGGKKQDELHLPMDTLLGFGLSMLGKPATLDAASFRRYLIEAQSQLHGQPLYVFDNHDNIRSMDRFGDGIHNQQIAKLVATLLYTTPAAALTYQGAEIGMITTTPTRKQDVRDPMGISGWPREKGRDGERTPMQWNPGPQAGFSSNPITWLPLAEDYKSVNVETEQATPNSLLRWTEMLLALRKSNDALRAGEIKFVDQNEPDVLCYLRDGPHPTLVMLNLSGKKKHLKLDLRAYGVDASLLRIVAESIPSPHQPSPAQFDLPAFDSVLASTQ